ncbi:hypothetical protein DQ04_10401010 [Trypanosoma grayi]|uniref:hypothetical protein n=1 Tax=Trypanosoma grayi TaxID=71804 RepID=UPI0004F4389E|nr:hypothetical protein DQ04_10401010 [Trypanosoma grayi]KEG07259.1 hypothetical protein DQ04_10401010 [Trypanosoma grayi]
MTFVFEARRLPFGDARAPSIHAGNDNSDADEVQLKDMPGWKKRLLPHVLSVVQSRYGNGAELLRWEVALRIVEELPELESAHARIIAYRERRREGAMTAEEHMMEEVLRERMGDDFLDDSDSGSVARGASSDEEEEDEDEEMDIAMCFNAKGEVVSIGSAGLFGGHGYHPQKSKS